MRSTTAPGCCGASRPPISAIRARVHATARTILKDSVAWLQCAVGVAVIARRRSRKQLAILMYHGIEAEGLSPDCWHVLAAADLRRQLHFLRNHFHVMPLDDALNRLREGTLPDHAAVLTFDDGTRNLLTHAGPILKDLRLPAAVFLSTGPMGTDGALWPDQLWLGIARTSKTEINLSELGLGIRSLREIEDRGAAYAAMVERLKDLDDHERITRFEAILEALGPIDPNDPGPFQLLSWDEARTLANEVEVALYPHTVSHPILARCSDQKVDFEITESCNAIRRETGSAPSVFAYPNGRAQDFDERARSALRAEGVDWALSTTVGFANECSDPLALPRIPIGSDLSYVRFQLLVSRGYVR